MTAIKKALIVGGGIGGLSLGIGLRQKGIAAEIIELQQEYNVYGAGIIQQANALRALDALGVADETMRRGAPYGKVKMCSSTGFAFAETGTPPIGRFPSHNGISRRILHDILYEEAVRLGVQFRMGTSVTAIHDHEDQVEVHFTDATFCNYEIVVAADGIYSKVRSLVFGEFPPQYAGASVWRYTFPRPAGLETGHMFFGKRSKLGLIPTTDDTIYMFVVTSEGQGNPFVPKEEQLDRLKTYLEEYEASFVKEVYPFLTDPEGINYRPLEVINIPKPWYKNRVILIGDAAHATVPQLGSGAALAIEDAVVLSEELAGKPSVAAAFAAYMDRRYERCKRIVDASEQVVAWEKLEFSGQPLPEGVNLGAFMGKTLMSLVEPI